MLYFTYSQGFIKKLFLIMNKFKFPLKFFWSKYLNPFLPNDDVKLTIVIGKGIKLPKIFKPTKDEVNKYHSLYIDSL